MIVRNQRAQPVELHLPGRVLVVAPGASAELDAAEAESPQLRVLARRRLVTLSHEEPAPARKADAPRAEAASKRSGTSQGQKPKGKPQAEGDE